jgi:hypothetical protein
VVTKPFNGFFLYSFDLAAPVPAMHLDGELTVLLERCSRCSSCPDDAAINPVTHESISVILLLLLSGAQLCQTKLASKGNK